MSTITDSPSQTETYHAMPRSANLAEQPVAEQSGHKQDSQVQTIVKRWAQINEALEIGKRLMRLTDSSQELCKHLEAQRKASELGQQTKEAMTSRKAELQMEAAREGNNEATRRALLQEKLDHDELYLKLKAQSEDCEKVARELEQKVAELKTSHSVIRLSIEADIAILNAIGAL